jgi:hypothetical protein
MWLGLVTVIVRQDFLEDLLVGQMLQQIQSQLHRP